MVTAPRPGSIAWDVSPLCTTSRAGRAVDAALDIGGDSSLKIRWRRAVRHQDSNCCTRQILSHRYSSASSCYGKRREAAPRSNLAVTASPLQFGRGIGRYRGARPWLTTKTLVGSTIGASFGHRFPAV